jgi:two-component system response regulator DesR
VLAASTGGASIADVAQLHLSDGTVRNYLSEAIPKLEAHNRRRSTHLAQQKGWL